MSIAGSANRLTVTDTGPGLYSERVDPDPDRVADGFGLAIVRELCEHNGWRLDLAEREPRGTIATIEFAAKLP
ncbi:MAG: ATP-binding protein [Acidobacteria bacterium]|nr:ATP-binding protein [Acidobacteriota bacterium]